MSRERADRRVERTRSCELSGDKPNWAGNAREVCEVATRAVIRPKDTSAVLTSFPILLSLQSSVAGLISASVTRAGWRATFALSEVCGGNRSCALRVQLGCFVSYL